MDGVAVARPGKVALSREIVVTIISVISTIACIARALRIIVYTLCRDVVCLATADIRIDGRGRHRLDAIESAIRFGRAVLNIAVEVLTGIGRIVGRDEGIRIYDRSEVGDRGVGIGVRSANAISHELEARVFHAWRIGIVVGPNTFRGQIDRVRAATRVEGRSRIRDLETLDRTLFASYAFVHRENGHICRARGSIAIVTRY